MVPSIRTINGKRISSKISATVVAVVWRRANANAKKMKQKSKTLKCIFECAFKCMRGTRHCTSLYRTTVSRAPQTSPANFFLLFALARTTTTGHTRSQYWFAEHGHSGCECDDMHTAEHTNVTLNRVPFTLLLYTN